MSRVALTFRYDGTKFSGYQVQPGQRTVQGEIEKALKKMHKGEYIKMHASGRTDQGVHANGQVAHFDSTLQISEKAWKNALNVNIPEDIQITAAHHVAEDWHARYNVEKKEYRYYVRNCSEIDIFRRNYEWHVPFPLDEKEMQCALQHFLGTHDFTSFCSSKTVTDNKVRTIYVANVTKEDEQLVFTFVGNGFLYNMVRIIVGTIIDVGRGKRNANDMPGIVAGRNRSLTGRMAPAHGLFLHEVMYKK
ncbi:MAG: tRNA pseudouridine(38-40) synthase TruA [Bacilli bacterium]